MEELIEILENAGFKTVFGHKAIIKAIKDVSDSNTKPLCSGYRVFPDGRTCNGCPDCDES